MGVCGSMLSETNWGVRMLSVLLVLILVFVIVMAVVLVLWLLRDKTTPSDVPFVYHVGAWSHQGGLVVSSLGVEILECSLNLLNHRSRVCIHLRGQIKTSAHWRPSIRAVHCAEQPVETAPQSADITLTPIVSVRSDPTYNGELVSFSLRQMRYLHSMGWGENRYTFSAQDQQQTIVLTQLK